MTHRLPVLVAALPGAIIALLAGCSHSGGPDGVEIKKAGVLQTATTIGAELSSLNDTARFLAGMPGGSNLGRPLRACHHLSEECFLSYAHG